MQPHVAVTENFAKARSEMKDVRKRGVFGPEGEALLDLVERQRAAEVKIATEREQLRDPTKFKNGEVARFFRVGQFFGDMFPQWTRGLADAAEVTFDRIALVNPASGESRPCMFTSDRCKYWDWRGWSYGSQEVAAKLLLTHGVEPEALRLIHPFTIGATIQLARVVDGERQLLGYIRPEGHTGDHAHMLQVPGGMPKPGETLQMAAARRLGEMTGIVTQEVEFLMDDLGHPIATMWELPHASSATVAFSATLPPETRIQLPDYFAWIGEDAIVAAGSPHGASAADRERSREARHELATRARDRLLACGNELPVAPDFFETLMVHRRHRSS